MQAHALTSLMQADLAASKHNPDDAWPAEDVPKYPFLTLLVSGKHTMLVYTKSTVNHRILASAHNIALGDVLDKFAREIVPPSHIPEGQETVVYPRLMEKLVGTEKASTYTAPSSRAHEDQTYRSEHGWELTPPLPENRSMQYNFSSFHGSIHQILKDRPDLTESQRRDLAFDVMRVAFEHVMSRVVLALERDDELRAHPPRHLVLSGGVTANLLLRRVASSTLSARGFPGVRVVAPDPTWCTDNAAMIAYTGALMYEDGWESRHEFVPRTSWSIEEILTGVDFWSRRAGYGPAAEMDAAGEQAAREKRLAEQDEDGESGTSPSFRYHYVSERHPKIDDLPRLAPAATKGPADDQDAHEQPQDSSSSGPQFSVRRVPLAAPRDEHLNEATADDSSQEKAWPEPQADLPRYPLPSRLKEMVDEAQQQTSSPGAQADLVVRAARHPPKRQSLADWKVGVSSESAKVSQQPDADTERR